MTRRLRQLVTTFAVLQACLVVFACPAFAGGPWGNTKHPGPKDPGAPPTTIDSEVHYQRSYDGAGAQMAPAAGSDWSPPVCWYEPKFAPEQFENYLESHYLSVQDAFATMAARYGADDFHKGDQGAWWKLEVPDLSKAEQCASLDDWAWITPGNPPAGIPVVDPKTLAGLAYAHTVLPAPPVMLRPAAQNELVNLGTEVAFALPLGRVTVTASLDNAALGVHVAATTVAEPYELRVDAGTDDADPRTCTYKLTGDGGTYHLDSHGDPCNVTYTRASPPGGYALTASIVWKVHWTPSADPDGPPAAEPALPDGESSKPTTVTVRENVTLNR